MRRRHVLRHRAHLDTATERRFATGFAAEHFKRLFGSTSVLIYSALSRPQVGAPFRSSVKMRTQTRFGRAWKSVSSKNQPLYNLGAP
jgi:hypothetical protein